MVEGTQVGAYRVLQQIGGGGMGSVWLAEHIALGRRAALKVLRPEFSTRPDIVTRFFNEARAATAIADPGIVQIFDFGHHVDGRAYIVMELLVGEPLDRRLEGEGALTLIDGLRLMRQVASTLGAAHACGIVHRDLKPENIYIVRDPEVPGGERAKVLDFGIAKLVGDDLGSRTHTSLVMGTPAFMSPEQCRGAGQVDPRSDVYSLGCVLFTLAAGRPPFTADGAGEIIAMHLLEPAPAPSQLRPGIPPEIDQLVLRCLAKDPAQRFQTASELASAIGGLLGSSPQIPTARPASYTKEAPTTLSAATGVDETPPAKRSRTGLIAAIASLGAAGFALAIVATQRGEPPVPAPPGPAPSAVVEDRLPGAAPSPPSAAMPPPAPSPAPSPSTASPAAEPPVPAPDPQRHVAPLLKEALVRFVAWSRDHRGAPCPDAAALGVPDDPWGRPPAITCTDQPGDQIAGAISAGPDGKHGSVDDVASWQLGRDVTDLVRGTRWVVARQRPAAKSVPAKPRPAVVAKPRPTGVAKPQPDAPAPATPTDVAKKPAPPVPLDDNGLPISR